MPEVVIRKKMTCVEEIFHEGGPVAESRCDARQRSRSSKIRLPDRMLPTSRDSWTISSLSVWKWRGR